MEAKAFPTGVDLEGGPHLKTFSTRIKELKAPPWLVRTSSPISEKFGLFPLKEIVRKQPKGLPHKLLHSEETFFPSLISEDFGGIGSPRGMH